MNIIRFLLCALVAGVVLPLRAAPTITLGTLAPEGTSYHRSLLEMREQWRKASGGGVNIRIFGGGKLGGDSKMVSQMRLGTLDAAMITANGLQDIEPAVHGLQSMPLMFRSLEEVDFVGEKLQPALEKQMEAKGFVVLFWSDAGWVKFFSKEAMQRPADLKKLKIFSWAGDVGGASVWRAAGYQPVSLETADIVPMLDTGLINSVAMPPFAALAAQIYDRAPYMLDLNWAPLVGGLVIRKSVWDKLPAAARPELLKAAKAAGVANKAQGRAESEKSIAAMKGKGLKVAPVTPEIEAEWRKEAEVFYPQIKGKVVPAATFDEVVRVLKEYRAGGAGKQ